MGFITIFGGTFNPIHTGHNEIINELSRSSLVDKVVLIPTKIPPHKESNYLASALDRHKMCEIIASDYNNVEVSDIELKRKGKSYTIDTVNQLISIYPDNKIALTIGGDMLVSFTSWKDYQELFKKCTIFAFKRSDISENEFDNAINNLKALGADIIEIKKSITDISSTEIRNLLLQNRVPDYLDTRIYNYIVNNNLYGV